jgi:hypothetical protein
MISFCSLLFRSLDLLMMAFFNSRERTLKEFENLVKEADPRLRIAGVKRPEGSILSFIEVVFEE